MPLTLGDAIAAATVVLLRTVPGEVGVECLMLRKNAGQSFGGMWVFPGGRVEPGDQRPDTPASEHAEAEDARRAAVREAAEETGLALGDTDLVPFAHWVPPEAAPKRFSTWFFVAALPEGAADVVVDGGEIGDHVWTTPGGALERHASGDIQLAPPTWVTLHTLAESLSPEEAVDRARREPIAFYSTHIGQHDDLLVALWAPDAGYEDGDLDAPGPRHRLVMAEGGWQFERSD